MARNSYSGPCYRCGEIVTPGTGHFERNPKAKNEKWRVQHSDCAMRWRGAAQEPTKGQALRAHHEHVERVNKKNRAMQKKHGLETVSSAQK